MLMVLTQSLVESAVPDSLIFYSNLKSHSTEDNQKVIPETPEIISFHQGSLCVKGFVAPENI